MSLVTRMKSSGCSGCVDAVPVANSSRSRRGGGRARTRRNSVADDSGTATARQFAALAEAISRFAACRSDREAIDRIVDGADGPTTYWMTLDAVIRTMKTPVILMRLWQCSSAYSNLQGGRRRRKSADSSQKNSSEEIEGAARLIRFGREIRKQVSGLVDIAIDQFSPRWLRSCARFSARPLDRTLDVVTGVVLEENRTGCFGSKAARHWKHCDSERVINKAPKPVGSRARHRRRSRKVRRRPVGQWPARTTAGVRPNCSSPS